MPRKRKREWSFDFGWDLVFVDYDSKTHTYKVTFVEAHKRIRLTEKQGEKVLEVLKTLYKMKKRHTSLRKYMEDLF